MSTFLTQFKYYLENYWHFVLLISLLCFSFSQTTTTEPVQANILNQISAKATIAVSIQAVHHASYHDWNKVVFDTPSDFSNTTILRHNHTSAWYKIQFDRLPRNNSLNFFQYETVVGFDEKGHELTRRTAETGSNERNHKRSLIFDLPDSSPCKIYYFKVFARKQQGNDTLCIKLQDRTELNNALYQDFYKNQNILMWIIFTFGIAFFQFVYIINLAWSRRKLEYYYYLAFWSVGIYYTYIARRFELGYLADFNVITSSILAYFVLMFFFYARFIRYYLDTKNNSPFTDQQFRKGEWFMLTGTIINLFIYVLTFDLEYTFCFFIPFSAFVIFIVSYLLILTYRLKMPLVKYLMIGALFMISTALLRLIYNYLERQGILPEVWDLDAFGTLTGGVIDALCLNLGLNYKHRLDILEKQKAIETMRNSIASDLHDDLGAGLSTIRLLGERAQIGLENPQKKQLIQKMTSEASQLIEKMSTVIWAINSRHDTLESMIAYFRVYALDYFEPSDLDCQFKLPDLPPSVSTALITGHTRKNLFLSFKEALHNIIKHAKATQVDISIQLKTNVLEVKISDNGIGTCSENLLGNGLKNMKERMESIGGRFSIFSEKNKGTTIVLSIIINKS